MNIQIHSKNKILPQTRPLTYNNICLGEVNEFLDI